MKPTCLLCSPEGPGNIEDAKSVRMKGLDSNYMYSDFLAFCGDLFIQGIERGVKANVMLRCQ